MFSVKAKKLTTSRLGTCSPSLSSDPVLTHSFCHAPAEGLAFSVAAATLEDVRSKTRARGGLLCLPHRSPAKQSACVDATAGRAASDSSRVPPIVVHRAAPRQDVWRRNTMGATKLVCERNARNVSRQHGRGEKKGGRRAQAGQIDAMADTRVCHCRTAPRDRARCQPCVPVTFGSP